MGNKHSPTVIAAAITSQMGKNKLPTHIEIGPENSQLKTESIVLTEQIRTIDKSRLKEKIGHIDDENVMNKINSALGVSVFLSKISSSVAIFLSFFLFICITTSSFFSVIFLCSEFRYSSIKEFNQRILLSIYG